MDAADLEGDLPGDDVTSALALLGAHWLAEHGGFFSIPEVALRSGSTVRVTLDNSGVLHFRLR